MRVIALPAALALSATLLSACVTEPPPRTELPAPPAAPEISLGDLRNARTAQLAALQRWQVKGKVAYRLPEDAGSASLDWQQNADQSRLRLSGPLGVGSTQISSEGALLRVRRDGIDRLYPADGAPWLPGEALLPIPVRSIQYWLRGLPDPTRPAEHLEFDGVTPASLEQSGWQVTYEEFRNIEGISMPVRLSLEAPAAELTLRVILRQWRWDADQTVE